MILPVQVAFELHCPQLISCGWCNALAARPCGQHQPASRSVHAGHKSLVSVQGILPPPKSCSYTFALCSVVKGRLIHLMPLNVSFTVHRGLCVSACQIDVRTYMACHYDKRLEWTCTCCCYKWKMYCISITLFAEYCNELKNTYTDVKDMFFGILLCVPISYGGQCCQ